MLKLSTRGRYGLRAMVELGRAGTQTPLMMSEIAKSQGFSRKYLHALLTSLKDAGLVRSVRGAKGGYLLAKAPEDILVSDIFRALEGDIAIVDCLLDEETCARAPNCIARKMWLSVNDCLRDKLEKIRLSDLVQDHPLEKCPEH